MPRLAVFDCDGTLADSQASICAAMGLCFADAGLPLPERGAILDGVGLSLPQAMARLAPDADHHALADGYRAHFRAMRADGRHAHEPLYDGIPAALDALAADGWLLAVATGKSDRGLALLLAHHGLTDRFVSLQTADRHPSKPDPAMLVAAMARAGAEAEETAMIGDTAWDMAMAVAAGVRPIGVGWGYHDPATLTAAGAIRVLDRPSDIAAMLVPA